ncbi:MAG TPA: prepilin-type N-terminal cleavage/methylation domain-containing protein [Opitutaceae bacterium]|nr:prepilin-type N-terminal cleavage/methylation domain-containing protein [Opitutaceae bacterium]
MKNNRHGFTLVEIMVASTVLLMVVAAALSVFLSINRSMYGLSDAVALNARTRVAQERIAFDLRALTKVTQSDPQALAGEFVEYATGHTGQIAYFFQGNNLVRRVTISGGTAETKVVMAELRTNGSETSHFAYANRSGVTTTTASEVRAVRLELAPLATARQAAGLTTGTNAPFTSALVQLRNINS